MKCYKYSKEWKKYAHILLALSSCLDIQFFNSILAYLFFVFGNPVYFEIDIFFKTACSFHEWVSSKISLSILIILSSLLSPKLIPWSLVTWFFWCATFEIWLTDIGSRWSFFTPPHIFIAMNVKQIWKKVYWEACFLWALTHLYLKSGILQLIIPSNYDRRSRGNKANGHQWCLSEKLKRL